MSFFNLNIVTLNPIQFFVACEPALSGYSVGCQQTHPLILTSTKTPVLQYATDFYQAITNITSGLMLPLTTANLLSHAIIGSVLENLDMERLIREVGQAVAQRILGNQESVDDVARELHEKLLLRNESTKKVVFENIYRESAEAKHNVQVFSEAPNLTAARPLLKKVSLDCMRVTEPQLIIRGITGSGESLHRKVSICAPPWSFHILDILGLQLCAHVTTSAFNTSIACSLSCAHWTVTSSQSVVGLCCFWGTYF